MALQRRPNGSENESGRAVPGRRALGSGRYRQRRRPCSRRRRHRWCLCTTAATAADSSLSLSSRVAGCGFGARSGRQGLELFESHNQGAGSTAGAGRSNRTSAPMRRRSSTSVLTQFHASSTVAVSTATITSRRAPASLASRKSPSRQPSCARLLLARAEQHHCLRPLRSVVQIVQTEQRARRHGGCPVGRERDSHDAC